MQSENILYCSSRNKINIENVHHYHNNWGRTIDSSVIAWSLSMLVLISAIKVKIGQLITYVLHQNTDSLQRLLQYPLTNRTLLSHFLLSVPFAPCVSSFFIKQPHLLLSPNINQSTKIQSWYFINTIFICQSNM